MERLDNSFVVQHKVMKSCHTGIALKTLPKVVKNVKAIPGVYYHLRCLHAIMYGHIGSTSSRIKNILDFDGFSPETDQEAKKKAVMKEKWKWNKGFLKWFLDLLDLSDSGTREDYVNRLFDFLACPRNV